MNLKDIPLEILILIQEMLEFDYSLVLCDALNISKELAFQYLKSYDKADANDKVMFAILSQDLELVKNALKDPSVTYEARDTNPFRIACEYGQFAVVKLLVNDYGIDISAHDNIALLKACEEGRIDIVKYIISHPDFNPEYCLECFILALDNLDFVSLLLEDKRFYPSVSRKSKKLLNYYLKILESILQIRRIKQLFGNVGTYECC